ncbi:MAG TPA: hypothetical protein VK907_13690, partial [Phnomibacter sp.]|nr:hypothetical protein [Phnomibacter sp.]
MNISKTMLVITSLGLTQILNAQNVGIGTNTPTQKLDIDGQIRIRGGAPGAGKVLTSAVDGTATWATPASGSNWTLLNGNVYRPTGNVGIGISTPSQTLHINSAAVNTSLHITNEGSGTLVSDGFLIGMQYQADEPTNRYNYLIGRENIPTFFLTNNVRRMTIGANGNIGIGTDQPTALLHVSGTGTGGGNILFAGSFKDANPGDPPASGDGTRLMWYPDKAAFRAGGVFGSQWDKDSIGYYSVAMGENARAIGGRSFAFGFDSRAFAFGSVALGEFSEARGNYSFALGRGTTALSGSEIAIGSYNTLNTPLSSTSFNNFDRLLVVGNGSSTNNRSDAMVIMKNGNTAIGMINPTQKLDIDGQLRIRGGAPGVGKVLTSAADGTASWATPSAGSNWILANGNVYRATGNVGLGTSTPKARLHVVESMVLFEGPTFLSQTPPDFIDPGSGARMIWIPQYGAFRAGYNFGGSWSVENTGRYSFAAGSMTKASGNTSAAFGEATEASGSISFAAGNRTNATGNYSTSIGWLTNANGRASFATGYTSNANGESSNALGSFATANGTSSFATGNGTIAGSYYSAAFGRFNVGNGNPTGWFSNDPIFEIGNGTSSDIR